MTLSITLFSRMTLSIMTFGIMTFGRMTLSMTALGIATFSRMTHSIMALRLSIKTFSIRTLRIKAEQCYAQHYYS
jgi:hypothetical protein